MKATEKRKLGRTTLEFTALGFGGRKWLETSIQASSKTRPWRRSTLPTYEGVRFFDSAPFYGQGLSEHRIGDVLRRHPRGSSVLSNKVGRLIRPKAEAGIDPEVFSDVLPFEPVFDYRSDGAMRSAEDSLQRLGLNRIDVALIHDLDIFTQGVEHVDQQFRETMDGAYPALDKLRSEGTVGAIGCGLNEWETCQRCAEAGDFDFFLLAGRYTLLAQDSVDPFLTLCQERGIGIIIGGTYNSGILVTGTVEGAMFDYDAAALEVLEKTRKIPTVCERYQIPLPAAALQFPLGHEAVSTVIPGARSTAEGG